MLEISWEKIASVLAVVLSTVVSVLYKLSKAWAKDRFDTLEGNYEVLANKVDETSKKVSEHDTDIAVVTERHEAIRGNVTDIKESVANLHEKLDAVLNNRNTG